MKKKVTFSSHIELFRTMKKNNAAIEYANTCGENFLKHLLVYRDSDVLMWRRGEGE